MGIIGLGFGRAHIPAFHACGSTIVAVCQRNLVGAKAIAEGYGIPQVFERWKDLPEQVKLEIVVIATPPHLRRQVCLRALSLGMHVLCEKPLALNMNEARERMDAAAATNRVGGTVFNFRYPAAMQRMHSIWAGPA